MKDKKHIENELSNKEILELIEDETISRYTEMFDWQRKDLTREELFEYAEEMRKSLDKIFQLSMKLRLRI